MTKSKYLTRADLVHHIDRAAQALKLGRDPVVVARYLRKVHKASSITWSEVKNTEKRQDSQERLERIVRESPGITFREISAALECSVNYAKTLVYDDDSYVVEPRHDKKGAYGRKPFGVWFEG